MMISMTMLRRFAPLLACAPVFLAAAELRAQLVLDPEPSYQEFHAEAAVRPDGNVLLTWTRQLEPGGAWSAMAATLDPDSGQLGELHEWGAGDTQQVAPLGAGYLAVREAFDSTPAWFIQRLDGSGRAVGTALPVGFVSSVALHATPDGGAVVVAGGVGGTGGPTQAWRFGPDGALLAGPVTLADSSLEVAVGVDAGGNVVLAWTDSGIRVFARRFSPDLQPLGPVVAVALGGGRGIRVAVAPDGRFVVVYAHSYQLWARPFRADGSPAGARRLFSPRYDFVDQEDIGVAIGPDGAILVVWKTYQDSNVPVIRARFLSLAGRPASKILRIAQIAGGRGELLRPRTESLGAGDFLILWTRVDAAGETLTLEGRHLSPAGR